ncbi:hypothetical protein AVEN_31155-1 [Araneus ventricosus]|uniref:Uncharacterized protein n=1 Tax=Araneus ventricosus TaxID=182803 RepID=A0A4Y2UVL4_ARAVE|nr:hypothetical protein AVEN_31155-1 [Araneus ventricosus]
MRTRCNPECNDYPRDSFSARQSHEYRQALAKTQMALRHSGKSEKEAADMDCEYQRMKLSAQLTLGKIYDISARHNFNNFRT